MTFLLHFLPYGLEREEFANSPGENKDEISPVYGIWFPKNGFALTPSASGMGSKWVCSAEKWLRLVSKWVRFMG
jgi:hypothetical protein